MKKVRNLCEKGGLAMNRKIFMTSFYLWILLATLFMNMFVGLKQVLADDLPTLFTNDALVLKGAPSVTEDKTNWQIDYQKNAGKIAFAFTDDQNQPITTLADHSNFQPLANEPGWYIEDTTQKSGQIQLNTPLSTSRIHISAKIYQTDENNQLTEPRTILFQLPEAIPLENVKTEQPKNTPAVSDASTDPSSTEKAASQTTTTTSSTEAPKAKLATIPAVKMAVVPLSGSLSPTDPFAYTNNAAGNYLTNSTAAYTNTQTSNAIRNYSFDKPLTEGLSNVRSIFSNTNLTFENGYHDYDDALLKKTIAPTSDPNQFDLQLDVIGKALTKRQKVDVIFVIDKSSSMNNSLDQGTRWSNAQTALKKFADDLLAPNDDVFRLALASFGSSDSTSEDIPFADIAKFGSTYFTNNATTFKNSSLVKDPPTSNSGTPTYLGVDAGYALATNAQFGSRADAAKVVITLTDGLPTFAQNTNYMNLTNRILDLPSSSSSDSSKIRYSAQKGNTNYFTGNGSGDQSPATLTFLTARNSDSTLQNIKRYSIGYTTGTNSVLQSLGKDGAYTADNGDQLNTILTNLSTALTATIQNAIVTDPMSSYVDLIGTPTIKALSLSGTTLSAISESDPNFPNYAKQLQKTISSTQIQVANINLGVENNIRQGIRINYRVQIKEPYRDGLFYLTNGTTSLKNQVNATPAYYHFAVPSALAPAKTITLQATKNWDDSNNKWGLRKDITLQLQQKKDGNWIDVANQVKTLSASATNLTVSFTGLPNYQNGSAIEYRVVETSSGKEFVSGYEKPTYTPASSTTGGPIKIVNKLKTTAISLKKFQADGTTPLANAKFGLYLKNQPQTLLQDSTSASDGSLNFSDLPIGDYLIKELTAPTGFKTMSDLPFSITQNEQGNLVVSGLPSDGKLLNQLQDFDFSFLKTSTTGTNLAGAVFELSKDGTKLETATSTSNGVVSFTQGLTPGQYSLKEVKAPIGYTMSNDSWTITIGQDQLVTIKNKNQEVLYSKKAVFDSSKNRWLIKDFTVTNQLNDFTLKVNKVDQSGNPLTGASFELTGPNQYKKELSNQSTFEFTNLKPGTYTLKETKTPDGYQPLKNPITIVIDSQGKVTIDQKEWPPVLSENGNVIQLNITNQVLMPLPKTGGTGLLPFIVIGLLIALTFGTILVQRRGGVHHEN